VHDGVVAQDLVKTYRTGRGANARTITALDHVSLEVPPGTVLGLLGPNGAGKTTSVNILTTLLQPDAGQAWVAGVNVISHPAQARRHFGLAGQSATVDENLTGHENLALVGRLCRLSRPDSHDRARALLRQFNLTDAAGRTVKTYSGGMRRRLDLAASLVTSPPVLFLDEPTAGLDPRSRLDLWAVIEELVAAGTTVLLTTQYLEEADRLASRIVVVDGGKVIAEGTAAELKSRLGTTVVEIGTAQPTLAVQALMGLGEGPASVGGTEGQTVRLGVSDGSAALAEIVRRLDAASVSVTSLALREPSLDDVFLELTGHTAEEGSRT
jgi:ABC-2 type transport system ATP-binding protein